MRSKRCRLVTVGSLLLLAAFAAPASGTSCIAMHDPGDVLVVRFAPALDPGSADLIDLLVVGDVTNLCGLEVDDGEGTLRFQWLPVAPGDLVRVVSAADLVLPSDARTTHVLVIGEDDGISRSSRFALAKGGDSIQLRAEATVVDAVAYGKTDPVEGWSGDPADAVRVDRRIFLRGSAGDDAVDTDTATDWTFPRIYRQHQEDRASPWFDVAGETRAFLCPDRCLEEVLLRIDEARGRIDVNLYDLSLREAVLPLAAAAERGVQVRVLLEERPVGASAAALDRLAWTVDTLVAAGATVHTLNDLRFDVNHAKYLVVDDTWTTVLSENANRNGWAPDGREGNRGWGLSVHDAGLATWMGALFEADFAHPDDARPVTGADLHPDAQPPNWGPVSTPAPGRVETLVVYDGVRVRPVVAPDHLGHPPASPLVAALRDAQAEIWTQQLNLPLDWARHGHTQPSPLIVPLLDAADRGLAVRGTLGAAFEDGDPETPGNDRTAKVLTDARPSIEIHLGDAPAGGLVHNKGWLVDPVPGGRNLAVIGSANGNLASQALNREVDLFVEHPAIAGYYRTALLGDWERARGPVAEDDAVSPVAGLPGPSAALFLIALGFLLHDRRRRSFDMASPHGAPRHR